MVDPWLFKVTIILRFARNLSKKFWLGNRPVTKGARLPWKNVLEITGYWTCLKNLSPSQKTLCSNPPGVPSWLRACWAMSNMQRVSAVLNMLPATPRRETHDSDGC